MNALRDPLDDRPVEHSCEGGFVYVGEKYAHAVALRRCDGKEDHPRFKIELDVARHNVYPCKVCRPAAFFRWAGGHYDSNHDASSCAECIEVIRGQRGGKSYTASEPRVPTHEPTVAMPRRDVDG